jgi:hypothetical protein
VQNRVVVEASARHPLTAMAPLWNRLHPAAPRPAGPSVDDLVAVLAEMGIRCQTEFFKRHRASRGTRAELVASEHGRDHRLDQMRAGLGEGAGERVAEPLRRLGP